MNDFQAMITATLSLFKLEFPIYGFTFSFWNVLLFAVVAGLVLRFIGGLFDE